MGRLRGAYARLDRRQRVVVRLVGSLALVATPIALVLLLGLPWYVDASLVVATGFLVACFVGPRGKRQGNGLSGRPSWWWL